MAQKSLGFVELEWTCKSCGTKNPGMQKTCISCGSPMPPEVAFELAAEQKLLEDKKKLEAAQQGADTFCPYCGTRNAAGAGTCIQCGGDLKTGKIRQSGQVHRRFQPGPAPEMSCPFCSTKIPANLQRCPKCGGDLTQKAAPAAPPPLVPPAKTKTPIWMIAGGIALLLLCCSIVGAVAILGARTTDKRGQVESVYWQRSIEIMEIARQTKATGKTACPGMPKHFLLRKAARYPQQPSPGCGGSLRRALHRGQGQWGGGSSAGLQV
ncbi:MAG: zinc ribbon domain-containing protein [Holophaga sp.]|nr:zinc ribbon domain-containing protein [Holophaga sp.]